MSDDERPREESQERERSEPAAAVEEYKVFVGGISWHMDDRELKDSKHIHPSARLGNQMESSLQEEDWLA